MKGIAVLAILALLLIGFPFALQTAECPLQPDREWNETYGGVHHDEAFAAIETNDTGYAIAGVTNSFGAGEHDFWLVKINSSGKMEWNMTYGNPYHDQAYSMVETTDGGYAIAGETAHGPTHSNMDFWLVKTDSSGNVQWNKTYGGTDDDHGEAVVQTTDGGYAIAGNTRSFGTGNFDLWLVKTDSSGNVEWNVTYGGPKYDTARSLIETSDGGYALVGFTESFGAGLRDVWLIRTNSTGGMLWNRTYGGPNHDNGDSLVETSDGGFAIAGTKDYLTGNADFWLIKVNSSGYAMWNKTYGGTSDDLAYSVALCSDEEYAVAGLTSSFGAGNEDFWLIKTDSSGNMLWNRTDGGTNDDRLRSMLQTSDGGYALAGHTMSFGVGGWDFWLIKLEPDKICGNLDIDPGTLNLNSKGQWITVYIGLPENYVATDIDVSTVLLNGSVPVDSEAPIEARDFDGDGVSDLMLKFSRVAVIELVRTNVVFTDRFMTITLTATGNLNDGTPFRGTKTIKIVVPKGEISQN